MSDTDACVDVMHFLEELDDTDLLSTLQNVFHDVMGPLNPSAPPPPPVVVPDLNIRPQIDQNLSGYGYGGCTPLGAAPHSVEPPSTLYSTAGAYNQGQQCYVHPQMNQNLRGGYGGCTALGAAPMSIGHAAPIPYQGPQYAMQPGPPYRQAGAYSQGQNLPYRPYVPSAAATPYAAPPLNQRMRPLGVLNGEVIYGFPVNFPATSTSAAPPRPPPPSTFTSNKRKREDGHDGRSYVKKPPNAFMLYMKEQRPIYAAVMKLTGTAGVNKILGDKWKSLSNEEQAKYFQVADRERRLHALQHPDWSSSNNYGQKRKRERSKASKMTEASASTSGEVTQEVKRMCVTPGYTGVRETHHAQSNVMQPSTSMKDVTVTHDAQSNMIKPSTLTTGVRETHHAQSNVMQPSTSKTSVTVTHHAQSNVMQPSTSTTVTHHAQSNVMQPSTSTTVTHHAQSNVMQPSTSTTSVTVTHHAQSNVMEPSTSMESNFMAGDKGLSTVEMLKLLEMSPPPTPQTLPPISEAVESQTTEPDYLTWLDDSNTVSFIDILESPPPTPQTQHHSASLCTDSASMYSPLALDDNQTTVSKLLAGIEYPPMAELLELLSG
ncbi:transcription factor 7-like 1-B isoform X2 [Sebastes umbrosus]|uniref:transcription factor 7-like 1-B isoform X2 n=1 Tax=Sebastes umbrosus TaxID=72105 RepID=UPI00189FF3B8|nr:transcription factor 7-like 1-B isoform X2 [Sebastes umbrosus]